MLLASFQARTWQYQWWSRKSCLGRQCLLTSFSDIMKNWYQNAKHHSKFNVEVLRKAAKRQHDSLNYLIKVRNQTFQSPSSSRSLRKKIGSRGLIQSPGGLVGLRVSTSQTQRSKLQQPKKQLFSQQKEFFKSKQLLIRIKEQERYQSEAFYFLQKQLQKKLEPLKTMKLLRKFMSDLQEQTQNLKICNKTDSIIIILKQIELFVQNNTVFTYICGKIRLILGNLYVQMFSLEEGERNLIFAELLSRTSENFLITLNSLEQLVKIYLKQEKIQLCKEKAISMLYLAVFSIDKEQKTNYGREFDYKQFQTRALNVLSICYYYEGNIAKSSFYNQKSLKGLDDQEIRGILLTFNNKARIQAIEARISGEKNKFIFEINNYDEVEPFDSQKVTGITLRNSNISKWPLQLKRILHKHPVRKVGRKNVPNLQKAQINQKDLIGTNSSQIYKMHRSTNRDWENYIVQIYRNKTGQSQFLTPNDNQLRKSFIKHVLKLQLFTQAINRQIDHQVHRYNTQNLNI